MLNAKRWTGKLTLISILNLILLTGISFAQETSVPEASAPQQKDALRVFMDRVWDQDFYKQEMSFLNYVNDTRDADLYILQTTQQTGGGGTEYTYTFQGLKAFEGVNDTLVFVTEPSEVAATRREGIMKMLKQGLMRYVSKTPYASRFEVVYKKPEGESSSVEVKDDPWNKWVFRLGMNSFFNGDDNYKNMNMNSNMRASRVTENWKFTSRVNMGYNETRYYADGEIENNGITYADGELYIKDIRKDYSFNTMLVKSISSHLSIGATSYNLSNTYRNTKLSYSLNPAIEYNFYDYAESTRHALLLIYELGLRHTKYNEITLYDKTEENIITSKFEVGAEIQEKWGNINASIDAIVNMESPEFNRFSFGGGFRYRILKGLSVDFHGNISRSRDQLNIRKEGLDAAEVLLRRREQQSDWNYFGMLGLSYTFGSIYNNVVNPRLDF